MKTLLLSSLSSICLLPALLAQSPTQFWNQLSKKPVVVQQINGSAKQNLKFIKFENGMLVAELDGGAAEISLPVNDSMASTLRYKIPKLELIQGYVKQKNYDEALKLMRPSIYPLVKFHELPSQFRQFHGPIRMLLQTLVQSENYDEVEFILSKIQLDKVGIEYSRFAGNLIDRYLEIDNLDGVTTLATSMPVNGIYRENITRLMDTADSLRAANRYAAVIPLYKTILPIVPKGAQPSMKMWLAYSLILNDQLEEGSEIFEELQQPAPDSQLFSLYKLLEGSRLYRSGEYSKALDVLTRGFVRARTSYDWVPEMLYLIGDCYAKAEDTLSASNVWEEITALYPSSPWAQRASESLGKLPKPNTTTTES
ncbi:MAG: hypothetical protein AAGC73_07145 [Verrucomicrobiota bacterium]